MGFTGQKSTPYIASILYQQGVEHVIICPGSRNAPLTLAFARHGKFNCISIIDERSAGYFALGMAQATQKPVVIICTSGTATLNFAPAIAEAYYQQIPLIVLTADRPEAWINQQDGQAIDQKKIYANIIAKSYLLRGELYHTDDAWYTERIVNEAYHICTSQLAPVHINISFTEPLYNDSYAPVNAKKIDLQHTSTLFSGWPNLLQNKKNILVVLGQQPYNEAVALAIDKFNMHPNVVVIAENLANILPANTISNASEALYFKTEAMVPDVIIYLGGPIVSKQLKKQVAAFTAPVIRVQPGDEIVDTFQQNVAVVKQSVQDGLQSLADYLAGNSHPSHFLYEWQEASKKALKSRNEYLHKIEFSDLKVFELLAAKIPEGTNIHLGNSTPVRYAQIFNDVYAADCRFYSNRGTSGIDGSSSTAAGFAYLNAGLNILITGDVSFQYDANAFFNKNLQGNLKVIVINNAGGNIFRVIDGPRDLQEREAYFETALQHEFSHLAKHFNLNYFLATNEKELNRAWLDFMEPSNRPSILEIFTDAELSAHTFKQLYKNLDA